MNSKLTIKFNNKAALNAATTLLTNLNSPFRNSSALNTKGVDVNTGEKVDTNFEETYQVTFATQYWSKRAEREIGLLFNDPNLSTCGEYIQTR